jgi:hypothetical protein
VLPPRTPIARRLIQRKCLHRARGAAAALRPRLPSRKAPPEGDPVFRPLVIVAALAVLAGCSQPNSGAAAPQAAAAANAPAAVAAPQAAAVPANEIFSAAPAPAQQAPAVNAGKVLQSQNGGGYTYAEIATASGQKVWIAGSQIDVKPGTEVQWGNYAVMRDFEAKSLGRKFPEILFVDRWGPVGQVAKAVAPHGSFPAPQAAGVTEGGPAAGGTVKSVTNAGGYSYIEVDQGGKTVWVAANETPMKQGDKVQWQGASEMRNFTAKSLGRTFDQILFAQSVAVQR